MSHASLYSSRDLVSFALAIAVVAISAIAVPSAITNATRSSVVIICVPFGVG